METIALAPEAFALERLREQELEEARAIQNIMLPAESLRTSAATISHAFQPVAEVGGDFLDYFELTDGSVGLYLGDVAGKGLPAAMFAALAVGTIRGVHKTGQAPGSVLTTLNNRLSIRGVPRRYAAIQYAVYEPRTRCLRVASAGMIGPLILSGGKCHTLELSGIPPGLFPRSTYDTQTLLLRPGDSVLFCTDGITDAMDLQNDNFGVRRLQTVCEDNSHLFAAELLGKIFGEVESFARGREQHDDMAAALFTCVA